MARTYKLRFVFCITIREYTRSIITYNDGRQINLTEMNISRRGWGSVHAIPRVHTTHSLLPPTLTASTRKNVAPRLRNGAKYIRFKRFCRREFRNGRAPERQSVAQLYGHGALCGIQPVGQRIGQLQFHDAVGHFGRRAEIVPPNDVQTHGS